MPVAAIVTIAAAVLIVVVLAVYLLALARVLRDVNRQLGAVVEAVGTMATSTEPVNEVVESIDRDLGAARHRLEALLIEKVGADRAAELIAAADPPPEADPRRSSPGGDRPES